MIRQAFVLGAGLGTRLLPLTAQRPKPLIPVANRPLITYAFDHLLAAGVEHFVVNTHWRAEAYAAAFPQPEYRGAPITFEHEFPEILETGGGLKNAEAHLRGGPFWVYNGDILSTLPLEPALRAHRDAANEATLILRSQGGPLQVTLDEQTGRVMDLGRRLDPAREPRFLFTGIYLVEPAFLARIPPRTKISVIPIFCEMIRARAKLSAVIIDEGDWWDLGTRAQYLAVHQALAPSVILSGAPAGEGGRSAVEGPGAIRTSVPGAAPWISPDAQLAADAAIHGATAIGPHARIGADARLTDCLIWDHAEVAPGAHLERCIVTSGALASGRICDGDLVEQAPPRASQT